MIGREITLLEIIIRMALTMILGGLIGIDRSLKNRPAGLRTHILVSIGSCLIMMINQYTFQVFHVGDPSRMGAQVVSGIGFLGAGTILISYAKKITGLTTAASLWASAAIGLALGIGFYEGALIGFLAIFASLAFLSKLDSKLEERQKSVEVYIELDGNTRLGDFLQEIYAKDYDISDLQIEPSQEGFSKGTSFIAQITSPKKIEKVEISDLLKKIQGVVFFVII